MDHSQGTADLAAPGASMQSLNDDLLRMILMRVPQDDKCGDDADRPSHTSGLAVP
jgi:hypothetical protein